MSETHSAAPKRSNWVAITTGVIGGVLLLGAASTAAVAGVFTANIDPNVVPQLIREDAAGIERIDVDSSAAQFVVGCEWPEGKGSEEFTLSTSTGGQEWRMERHGDTLKVEPVSRWFGGFSVIGPRSDALQAVTLLLPTSVCEGENILDADLEVSAGDLTVEGAFGVLDLSVGAGQARVDGTVETLEVDVSAGEAVLYLNDVQTADLSVAAGSLRGSIDGTAPSRVDIEVSAGDAAIWLPDEVYSVKSEVAIGDFENGLRVDNSMTARQVSVEVAAGHLILQPQD